MNTEKLFVRLAEQADCEFVGQDGVLTQEMVLGKIQRGEIFLLLVAGQPAGYLWIEFLWSLVPYISLIMIREIHRKKGYSHVLLSHVKAHLRAKGYNVLYSSSQLDEPQPQAWHRHMGFEECG
ncbi:MAG: GNAT family N-acetyltransferase, partial [Anaerolineales bacterium]